MRQYDRDLDQGYSHNKCVELKRLLLPWLPTDPFGSESLDYTVSLLGLAEFGLPPGDYFIIDSPPTPPVVTATRVDHPRVFSWRTGSLRKNTQAARLTRKY